MIREGMNIELGRYLKIRCNGQEITITDNYPHIELIFEGFGKDGDGTIIENGTGLFKTLTKEYNFIDFFKEDELLPIVIDKKTKFGAPDYDFIK